MILKKHILLPLVLIVFISCESGSDLEYAENTITSESLMAPIEILSSDEFEGRAPATRGEDLTVDYLIEYLQTAGIEGGMPDGSYVQEFPLISQNVDRETVRFRINSGNEILHSLGFYDDFMAWPANQEEIVRVQNAEVVYVGYGIQAPEYDWDDYKKMDMSGKVLVFKNSDPAYDPDIFDGDSRLYYGRWSYKFEKAEELGALGAIIVHTEPTAGYPWLVVANSWGRERFYLMSEAEDNGGLPEFNSWLTKESSEKLFAAAGLDLDEQLEAADDPGFQPVVLEGVSIDVEMAADYQRDMNSRNVLGKIEGNDPQLNDEYLVFTAHYDHLGITVPVEGDSINNGALDNAAGVSAVLNLATAYKQIVGQMRRSALFLFVGAEEMGLLGSQYWAENPTVHPGKVTANINLDGMNVYGETEDVVLIGYDRNTVSDIIAEQAEMIGRVVKPDPNPEQGYFYRSDHFSLANVGIPAIFPNSGRDFINKPDGYNDVVDSLMSANYHNVHDEINEHWDLSGMERDTRLFFRSGMEILNADRMMEWRPGDEFEITRRQMLQEAGYVGVSIIPDLSCDRQQVWANIDMNRFSYILL
jgi:Zn-dependent M28 family amino/carboxypeptidase